MIDIGFAILPLRVSLNDFDSFGEEGEAYPKMRHRNAKHSAATTLQPLLLFDALEWRSKVEFRPDRLTRRPADCQNGDNRDQMPIIKDMITVKLLYKKCKIVVKLFTLFTHVLCLYLSENQRIMAHGLLFAWGNSLIKRQLR